MAEEQKPRVILMPSDEEMKVIFEAYALAVGKVAHSWNFLLERLGRIFELVMDAEESMALAVWWSTESDRVQLLMLQSAILASPEDRWMPRLPKARKELKWLADTVLRLSNSRNDAIHAPCSLMIDADYADMAASYVSGHRRAKNLRGKQLLIEFDWCERWAEELARFTEKVQTALSHESYPWPERPEKPTRKHRKDLPGLRRPTPSESLPPQLRSSRK